MIQRTPIANDLVTFDSFVALVGDGQKADSIDGVMYMASPDTKRSNSLTLFLATLLYDFTVARGIDGFAFISRFACKINDLRAPEPEVGYVRPERAHLVHDRHMEGGPDIAVGIVSRESKSRDYGEKRELYESAGVSEYWIVDPIQRRVEFPRLTRGRYEPVPLEDNRIFRSEVIPGFWLDIEWLLAKDVPGAYRCLHKILAEGRSKRTKHKR
jgi:Uma2 family endonuclease